METIELELAPIIGSLSDAEPEADVTLPDQIVLSAFGQKLTLSAPKFPFARNDALWRLRHIYEPALTARTLAPTGVAVDIGAGFGAFALPFARAFPGWTIHCFEPDPAAYASLTENIAALGLTNVVALRYAMAADDTELPAGDLAALGDRLPLRLYSRHLRDVGFMRPGDMQQSDYHGFTAPTLPARLLTSLRPNLLKLTAPFAEAGILADLKAAPLDHIIGEAWSHIPSALVSEACAGQRQTWIPLAGQPLLGLRRTNDLAGRAQRLDLVVAMYNTRAYVLDCIAGILNGESEDVRVLVVDDGSTDGCGDLVAEHYGADPRVRLLRKPNGGCASARNYGRLNSDASHIAFVDADDVPGPGLFSGLLELARHTGAEIVQGGFEMLYEDETGLRVVPSYEEAADLVKHAQRHPFGTGTCHLLPSTYLMQGQPTIWRRVYRRDFIDNRKIWFPEHIRAFDDQIFQMLTLQAAGNVPVLDGVAYGYRQHPAQDIRQGDERNFYSLEMFRLMLKRAMSEGWNDFDPLLRSFVNTVNWITAKLRPDLRPAFVKGAAELWVYARKTLGEHAFRDLPATAIDAADFSHYVSVLEAKLKGMDNSYAWTYLDSFEMQVPMMKAARG